ncbi:MAG: protein kinase [Myxococcota bacterium]|jgi:serine/threonine protein kinase|nr:protein kinase [Myxococcota bacterium]
MGERWGKYELVSLIAKGGMAEVFRAEQLGPAGFVRPVCLKCVRSEYSSDPQFVSMFEAEARIAATLQHPNIVHVSDFDRHEGRLFLVMELVDGWDLRHILARTRQLGLALPLGVVMHLIEALLLALEHAHGRVIDGIPLPVVHRDVSPHNILVSVEGVVKLADFGIAKARGQSDTTRTGIVKGKLAYLSPEQARGEPATPLSDLWSAGLVLYEMLSGRRALGGEDDAALLARLHRFELVPIPGLADGLTGFLTRLLAPLPAQRFQSALAALSALRQLGVPSASMKEVGRLVQGLQSAAPDVGVKEPAPDRAVSPPPPQSLELVPETHGTRPGRTVRQSVRRWPVMAMVVAAVALLGLSLFWSSRGVEPLASKKASDVAPQPTLAPEPAPSIAASAAEIRILPSPTEGPSPARRNPAQTGASSTSKQTASESKGTGTLSVFVRPWANVVVDGVPLGQTPLKNLRLSAGTHRVELSNEELGYQSTLEVDIDTGAQEVINRTIERP